MVNHTTRSAVGKLALGLILAVLLAGRGQGRGGL